MSKRAISGKMRKWLLAEMKDWRDSSLISTDQSDRILELYETTAEVSQRKHSLAFFAVMSVAAFFVGLAVLLLIGYNWDAMPSLVKLVIIFGVIGGTYALGFWLRYSRQEYRGSEILFFLGCLFYGCGIWLIAQIFHIQGHYPNGLWIWALGVLPFALCLDTLLIHTLFVVLLAIWVGTEILDFRHFWRPWIFGRWFSLPSACFTLPLLTLPGLIWAYRRSSPATVALYVSLLAWWVILLPIAWHAEADVVYFIGTVGALFLAIAETHSSGSPMARPYRVLGVIITAGILSVMSFGDAISSFLRYGSEEWYYKIAAAAFILLIGIVAVMIDYRFKPMAGVHGHRKRGPFAEIINRQWLPVGLIFLMAVLCAWSGLFGAWNISPGAYSGGMHRWTVAVILPTIATNAAMITFALWLSGVGLWDDQGTTFAAGVILLLLWAVFRYIDLFAGVGGMLGASLMFFLCGAFLFAMGRFWLKRKETNDV